MQYAISTKNKIFQVLLFFLIYANCFSQNEARFYKTIDTLSSQTFYGRGYLNQGHLKTADYLITAFEAYSDTAFKQAFSFGLNVIANEQLIIGNDTLATGVDFVPLPQSSSTYGLESFETVFLDSLFFHSRRKITKFIKKSIENKAIVYSSKFEGFITSNKLLHRKIYVESGAIIKLTDSDLMSSFSQSAWMPPSVIMKADHWTYPEIVQLEVSQTEKSINSFNVIGQINGTDTSQKELIVCAHYDHVGGYSDCFVPGANDNASGVAMLLELMNYFYINKPYRTMKFIAFGAEEVGLLGSSYYVQNASLDNIHFVLNLDLLGAGSKGLTVVNGSVFKEKFELLNTINIQNSYFTKIKKRGEAANSDHYYFSKNGVPAFFVYSNGTVGGYHNVKDKPDDLEKGYFGNIFGLLRDFLIEL